MEVEFVTWTFARTGKCEYSFNFGIQTSELALYILALVGTGDSNRVQHATEFHDSTLSFCTHQEHTR